MTNDLVDTIKLEAVNSEIDRHLAGRIINALMAVEARIADGARIEALTALVREADELIGGDLVGLEWKLKCSEFRVKARAALNLGKDTP